MTDYDPNFVHKKVYFIVGCKAVVLNEEGKILVLRRTDKSGLGGKWSLPGGAIEENENPFEAIRREIDEETKITVSNLQVFHTKTSKNNSGDNVIIIGFICKNDSGSIVLNWEHDQFQWLNKKEALSLKLTPDGRVFLENLILD